MVDWKEKIKGDGGLEGENRRIDDGLEGDIRSLGRR